MIISYSSILINLLPHHHDGASQQSDHHTVQAISTTPHARAPSAFIQQPHHFQRMSLNATIIPTPPRKAPPLEPDCIHASHTQAKALRTAQADFNNYLRSRCGIMKTQCIHNGYTNSSVVAEVEKALQGLREDARNGFVLAGEEYMTDETSERVREVVERVAESRETKPGMG